MTLSTLDSLSARVCDPLPDHMITDDFTTDDFLARVEVEASDQVHLVPDSCEGGAFTGRGSPLLLEGDMDVNSETFSLLHALDVGLKTADELVDEFVSGDVLGRIDHELFVFFFIARLGVLVNNARHGTTVFDSLVDNLGIGVLFEEL